MQKIALGADIRYVAPDAQLSVLEIKWGLIPDMSISQTLLRLIPLDVAKELTFTGRIVSGTEAVEGALKLARHHTGRPNVIAFYGAFHGRSLGSLSLTSSKAKYRSGFGIVTPGSYHAPFAFDGEVTGADYIEQADHDGSADPARVYGSIVLLGLEQGGVGRTEAACERLAADFVLDNPFRHITQTDTLQPWQLRGRAARHR